MFRYFLARDIYNMGERRIHIKEKKNGFNDLQMQLP